MQQTRKDEARSRKKCPLDHDVAVAGAGMVLRICRLAAKLVTMRSAFCGVHEFYILGLATFVFGGKIGRLIDYQQNAFVGVAVDVVALGFVLDCTGATSACPCEESL